MPLIDQIAAGLVIGLGTGVLAARAFRSWLEFRRQRATATLLDRSARMLERDRPPITDGRRGARG